MYKKKIRWGIEMEKIRTRIIWVYHFLFSSGAKTVIDKLIEVSETINILKCEMLELFRKIEYSSSRAETSITQSYDAKKLSQDTAVEVRKQDSVLLDLREEINSLKKEIKLFREKMAE